MTGVHRDFAEPAYPGRSLGRCRWHRGAHHWGSSCSDNGSWPMP